MFLITIRNVTSPLPPNQLHWLTSKQLHFRPTDVRVRCSFFDSQVCLELKTFSWGLTHLHNSVQVQTKPKQHWHFFLLNYIQSNFAIDLNITLKSAVVDAPKYTRLIFTCSASFFFFLHAYTMYLSSQAHKHDTWPRVNDSVSVPYM